MRTKEKIETEIKHVESVIKDYHDFINKNLTTKLNKLQQELKECALVIPQEGCIYKIKFSSGEELDIAVVKVHEGNDSGAVDFVPVGENKINYVSEQECYFFSNQPHYKITKLASSLKEYFDLEKHIYGVRNQRAFEKEINSIVEICKTTASYHKDAVSSYVENFNQA